MIALDLERDRLEHRMLRMELVTSALRDRVLYRHAAQGTVPLALRQAIESFELEIAAMRCRLIELQPADAATGSDAALNVLSGRA